MSLSRADATRRLVRQGFRCGDPVASDSRSVVTCVLRRNHVTYRVLVVSSPTGNLRFVAASARTSSGRPVSASTVFGSIATMPTEGKNKLVTRVEGFVDKWLGRGRAADGRFGSTRVRVYGEGESWNLLVSPV